MIIANYIIISIYIITMIVILIGYQKVPSFKYIKSESIAPQTKFSVVIPFRNEANNLPALLNSIITINYPLSLFEIIFVDDDSEDISVQLIEDFFKSHQNLGINFQIIPNKHTSNSPKKDAITSAIKIAKNPWIITTDADCILPINWLVTLDSFIQKKDPNMIVGPVSYQKSNSLINSYQQLDNFSLQAATIGTFGLKSPLLSNGANLAYKKECFKKVNGFIGNDHLASGDDIFLLEKFVKEDSFRVNFLKSIEAMVVTKTENSWKEIITQRIRWASKTSKQKNNISKGLGALVFSTNLMIILLAISSFIDVSYCFHLAIILVLKMIVDVIIIYNHAINFNLKINPISIFVCEILYPFITIFVVFGSLFGTYSWKKRAYKK